MTIDQVIKELTAEKQAGTSSRFPCRAVMVKNVRQYKELLAKLKTIPDIAVVPPGDLFSAADIMPRYENLTASKYSDQWLILPGVSEYLRLFSKSEAVSQRFARLWKKQLAATNTGRIIIPLWGCEAQWHDKSLNLYDDIRQDAFYYDCVEDAAEAEHLSILVLSGEFQKYVYTLAAQKRHVSVGLQEWYEYWTNPADTRKEHILLTDRCALIQPTAGDITVKIITDRFAFVRENLAGAQVLTEQNCPKPAQELLFEQAVQGGTLAHAVLSALNVAAFSGVSVMSQWSTMSPGKKQLVMLWYTLHPDDTYLCHCVQSAQGLADIPDHVLHDVFAACTADPGRADAWVRESQDLIEAMGLQKDERYFSALDAIPGYAERLRFLSGKDKGDRIYLLRLVGKWLREDPAQVQAAEQLPQIYPALSAYLDRDGYDQELGQYFSRYKAHKLENSLPADEELYFSGLQPDVYDYRYAVLSDMLTEDCIVLWVDALGAEWLPLLAWTLAQDENGTLKETRVAQANLPTETCFNEQWKQMDIPYKKLDRLDKLAHKGVIDDPDYYTCIEDQLSFVAGLRKAVDELLKEYRRVIITGDHGTSRLAARFFHKRTGASVLAGATVCSHGRYCRLPENGTIPQPNIAYAKDSAGSQYAVFSNYDHFIQSGFAAGVDDENAIYGEVHGGATPEEMLVPVVVFDSKKEIPLSAVWGADTVKIMAKKARASLRFNRPVHSVQAKIGTADGVCTPTADGKVWNVVFSGVAPNTHTISLVADGKLVSVGPLTILPALGGGDGGLP